MDNSGIKIMTRSKLPCVVEENDRAFSFKLSAYWIFGFEQHF